MLMSFLYLNVHNIFYLVTAPCILLRSSQLRGLFGTGIRLFVFLKALPVQNVSFVELQPHEVAKKRVSLLMLIIRNPFMQRRQSKLLHQDVPVVKIGIGFAIWVSQMMRQKLLRVYSKYINISASALPGKLLRLKQDYLESRVSNSISLLWLYKGFIDNYKNYINMIRSPQFKQKSLSKSPIPDNYGGKKQNLLVICMGKTLEIKKYFLDLKLFFHFQNLNSIADNNFISLHFLILELKPTQKLSSALLILYSYSQFSHSKIISQQMLEEDTQIYQFTLTIKQIKLAVKFPCKLTLNYLNRTIKSQVSADQTGKYTIQREVKAKADANENVQILIHLTTQKGGNIMAGIIKLAPKELAVAQGQTMNVTLQKCLDQNASCLIKVDRVWISKVAKAKSSVGQLSSRKRNYLEQIGGSNKKLQPTVIDNYQNEVRSQFPGFDLKRNRGYRQGLDSYNINGKQRMYGLGPKSYVPEIQITKSKGLDRSMEYRKDRYRFEDDNKTVGKKQIDPSYRLTLEANQKNLKMDIMKYKMKSEQHEKTIEQKNKQIKLLKEEIAELHRQSVEKNFYQQEINSKNNQISKLQQNYKSLNKENTRLEAKIIQLQRLLEEVKNNLKSAVQKANQEKERRQMELSRQISLKNQEVNQMNDEINSKNNQVMRLKKIIEDYEKAIQNKTLDNEKMLQIERQQMRKIQTLQNDKIKQLQQMNKTLLSQNEEAVQKNKKLAQDLQHFQSSNKSILIQLKEVTELQKYYATYKEKLNELTKSYERLDEEKKQIQKHYLKVVDFKQRDLGEFKNQHINMLNSYKKKNQQLNEKVKQQINRILELETETNTLKSDMEKYKRAVEVAQKQQARWTEVQKNLTQLCKQKEDIILQLRRQLSQLQQKTSSRQNLLKKDLDYKQEQLNKTSARLTQIQILYRQEKENNQNLRFDSTKVEGKVKLQQEIIHRLNRQIEETKISFQKRESQLKQEIHQDSQKLKTYEQVQKRLNKQISEWQFNDMNRKNEISRLQKQLQVRNQKLEREKARMNQLSQKHKILQKQIYERQEYQNQLENQLKQLQNNKKMLQADFTKTQKIKTIIVQEKTTAENQLINLKKIIAQKQLHEKTLSKQLKDQKQQNVKINLKLHNLLQEYEKFKESIHSAVTASFYNKGSPSFNLGLSTGYNSERTKHRTSSTIELALPLTSPRTPRNLYDSAVNLSRSQDIYEPKYSQIIESYAKESQQTITQLNETIRKIRGQNERLEKQISQLNNKMSKLQQQSLENITKLQRDIQQTQKAQQNSQQRHKQKELQLQRSIRQREQAVQQLQSELQELNHELHSQVRAFNIQRQQLSMKVEQLKSRLYDSQTKSDVNNMTILTYEEKIFGLQAQINQLNEKLHYENQKVQRKDKLLFQHANKIQELNLSFEQIKRDKDQFQKNYLDVKEKLQNQIQINERYQQVISEQEEKNKEIKGFTNNLMKEKESIVKNQIQKSEKVLRLQDELSQERIEKNDLRADLQAANSTINQLKNSTKNLTGQIKQLQGQVEKVQHQLKKTIQLCKQREKTIQKYELELKNNQIEEQKLITKYESQTKRLNQEGEEIVLKYTKTLEEKQNIILELSNEIQKYKHLEKKLSEQNIALEEQIFFEKQTNSLASSRFDSMSKEQSEIQDKLTQAVKQIQLLNEQIRDRQEKLFDMSGKVYNLENKLQMKDIQLRERLEKLDIDWKNKYEETLQDYQAKLESHQREKLYLRSKIEEAMEDVQKLQNQKRMLLTEEESNKKTVEDKIRKIESEKLALLVQKNKQIEKYRQEVQQAQQRIKAIRYQKDLKIDQLRRAEEKIKQKDTSLSFREEKHLQAIKALEKDLEYQKRKTVDIKKYKEMIKNNQWASQRDIKRILQSYLKNLIQLCEEQKKKDCMDVMKKIENQVMKAIEWNGDSEQI